jgi:hypothetical protein
LPRAKPKHGFASRTNQNDTPPQFLEVPESEAEQELNLWKENNPDTDFRVVNEKAERA